MMPMPSPSGSERWTPPAWRWEILDWKPGGLWTHRGPALLVFSTSKDHWIRSSRLSDVPGAWTEEQQEAAIATRYVAQGRRWWRWFPKSCGVCGCLPRAPIQKHAQQLSEIAFRIGKGSLGMGFHCCVQHAQTHQLHQLHQGRRCPIYPGRGETELNWHTGKQGNMCAASASVFWWAEHRSCGTGL